MAASTEEDLAKQLLAALEDTRHLQRLHDEFVAKFDELVNGAKDAVLDVEDIRLDITRLGLSSHLADSFDTAAHRIQFNANLAKLLSDKANAIARDLEAAKKHKTRIRDELFAYHARESNWKEYERRKSSIDKLWEDLMRPDPVQEKRERARRHREYVRLYWEEEWYWEQRRPDLKAARERREAQERAEAQAEAQAEARRRTAEAEWEFNRRKGPDPRAKREGQKPKSSQGGRKGPDPRARYEMPKSQPSQPEWKKPDKTIKKWRQDVEIAFQDYSAIGNRVPFPLPPAWGRCAKASCTTIGGGGWGQPICACQVQYAFQQAGVKVKTERLRWHPDRFSVCPKEVGAMAEEVFKIVNSMHEKGRR